MGTQAMSSGGAISRQGSVCSLTLSEVEGQLHGVNLDDLLRTAGSARKTADEVWRDIQSGGGRALPPAPGQMTLEDFLSKSVSDARWAEQYNPPPPAPAKGGQQQQRHSVGRPLPRPLGVGAEPVLDALLYHDGPPPLNGRKRAAEAGLGGPGEKTVERRKKRMIKNRESAARSRARKQAYTNELELELAQLRRDNQMLLKRHQDLNARLAMEAQVPDRSTLQRCRSAPAP